MSPAAEWKSQTQTHTKGERAICTMHLIQPWLVRASWTLRQANRKWNVYCLAMYSRVNVIRSVCLRATDKSYTLSCTSFLHPMPLLKPPYNKVWIWREGAECFHFVSALEWELMGQGELAHEGPPLGSELPCHRAVRLEIPWCPPSGFWSVRSNKPFSSMLHGGSCVLTAGGYTLHYRPPQWKGRNTRSSATRMLENQAAPGRCTASLTSPYSIACVNSPSCRWGRAYQT